MIMEVKTVGLASDHAGFPMKQFVLQYLEKKGYPVKDYGTYSDESVDYPDFAHALAEGIENGAKAEAHTLTIPVEAREALLSRLSDDLYRDFQMLDTTKIQGGQKTATEITAARTAWYSRRRDPLPHSCRSRCRRRSRTPPSGLE